MSNLVDNLKSTAALLLIAGLAIAGLAGYVLNLIAIAHSAGLNGMLVLRVLGVVFAPLGAVVGWI